MRPRAVREIADDLTCGVDAASGGEASAPDIYRGEAAVGVEEEAVRPSAVREEADYLTGVVDAASGCEARARDVDRGEGVGRSLCRCRRRKHTHDDAPR